MNFRIEIRMATTGFLVLDQNGNVPLGVPRVGDLISTCYDPGTKYKVREVEWHYESDRTLITVTVEKHYK